MLALLVVWVLLGTCYVLPSTADPAPWPNAFDEFYQGGPRGLLETDHELARRDFRSYHRVVALELLLVHHGFRACQSSRGDDQTDLDATRRAVEAFQLSRNISVSASQLDPVFWQHLVVPLHPGESSSAVLALQWLALATSTSARPPLWDVAAVQLHGCIAEFDASLVPAVEPACAVGSVAGGNGSLGEDCWQALFSKTEISAGLCEVRGAVAHAFGVLWAVVWIVVAAAFVGFHQDCKGSATSAVAVGAFATAGLRARVVVPFFAVAVCHSLATVGIWSFPHDFLRLLLLALLVTAGATVLVQLAAVRYFADGHRKALLDALVFALGNVGIWVFTIFLPRQRGYWLLVVLAISMVWWSAATFLMTRHSRTTRGALLFCMLLLATGLPTLMSTASGFVSLESLWLPACAPTGLLAVSLVSERVVGHFMVQRCEYTAETQWLLAVLFRLCIELARLNTALAVLLVSILSDSGLWFLLMHLLQSLVFEAAARIPRQSAAAVGAATSSPVRKASSNDLGPPFTAAEIVLRVGLHPWVYRSRAVMFPIELVLLLSHVCQLVFIGLPVGVGAGAWGLGLLMIWLEVLLHEAVAFLVDRRSGSVAPRMPWTRLSGHLLALMVGVGMAMSTFAHVANLWLVYAHHWAACFQNGARSTDSASSAIAAASVARTAATPALAVLALILVAHAFLIWLLRVARPDQRTALPPPHQLAKLAVVVPADAEDTDGEPVPDLVRAVSGWASSRGPSVIQDSSLQLNQSLQSSLAARSGSEVQLCENMSRTWEFTLRSLWDDPTPQSAEPRATPCSSSNSFVRVAPEDPAVELAAVVNEMEIAEQTQGGLGEGSQAAAEAIVEEDLQSSAKGVDVAFADMEGLLSDSLLRDLDMSEPHESSGHGAPEDECSQLLLDVLSEMPVAASPETTGELLYPTGTPTPEPMPELEVAQGATTNSARARDAVHVYLSKTLTKDDLNELMDSLEPENEENEAADSSAGGDATAGVVVGGEAELRPPLEAIVALEATETVVSAASGNQERAAAQEALADAVSARSRALLERWIPDAESKAVPCENVDQAKHVLKELIEEEARANAAIAAEAARQAAMAAAAEAEARAVAEREAVRLNVQHALADAVLRRSQFEVRERINEAQAHGVSEELVAEAQRVLQELVEEEHREVALRALVSACEEEDLDAIRSKLALAREARVEEQQIALGAAKLEDLMQREAARRALQDAAAPRSSLALDAQVARLRQAVANAGFAGVPRSDLQAPLELLAGLEGKLRCQAAQAAMLEALSAHDIARTRVALVEARAAGVEDARIAHAERGLRDLEEELELAHDQEKLLVRRIENAMAAKDEAEFATTSAQVQDMLGEGSVTKALRSVIDDAKKMRLVHRGEVQKAEAVLNEVTADLKRILHAKQHQEQKHAEEKLLADMELSRRAWPTTQLVLESLFEAINAAKVFNANTRDAEALLSTLMVEHERQTAMARERVALAIETRDMEAIKAGVEACRSLLLTETVSNALRQTRGIVAEEIASAREESERDERLRRLPGIEGMIGVLRQLGDVQLRQFHNDLQDLKGALRVFCRVRPLNKRERELGDTVGVEVADPFTVSVQPAGGDSQAFCYDAIFGPQSSQAEVFSDVCSLVQSAFDGYNVTIFSYGQTGAGKTWTLYGSGQEPGISPRTCEEVFRLVERDSERLSCEVRASMVELYLNDLRDLLSKSKDPAKLDFKSVRQQDGSVGVRLEGATEVEVRSAEDLAHVVMTGLGQRKVKKTNMNADSSRSHLMLLISLQVADRATGRRRSGKITLVDLAGSERLAKSGVTGEGQREAIEINKSLTALGDVMMAFTNRSKVIPYRNHKLTQLMQDSLGGSAKTLMFVNVSPASSNLDETVNALKYASRARCIENDVKKHK